MAGRRLFVAIELTDEAQRAIASEQDRLRDALGRGKAASIKWIAPDHLHLTLAFLGHVDDARADAVVDGMRHGFDTRRFSIVFGGLGVFPPHGEPRVLWVGLMRGADDVGAVQRQVAGRVADLGVTLEDRAYHPHLTIARWKSARRSDRHLVLDRDTAAAITGLEVSSVTLMESRLSPAGSTYIALCRSPLAGSVSPREMADG
jgi:2'-5' RNA ligase